MTDIGQELNLNIWRYAKSFQTFSQAGKNGPPKSAKSLRGAEHAGATQPGPSPGNEIINVTGEPSPCHTVKKNERIKKWQRMY